MTPPHSTRCFQRRWGALVFAKSSGFVPFIDSYVPTQALRQNQEIGANCRWNKFMFLYRIWDIRVLGEFHAQQVYIVVLPGSFGRIVYVSMEFGIDWRVLPPTGV